MATNAKRILSIEVEKMDDDSPDTSWLGEYSNSPAGDFSIDRKHATDCTINHGSETIVNQLERVIAYLDSQRLERVHDNEPSLPMPQFGTICSIFENLVQAQDILIACQDDVLTCNCDGGDMESGEYRYFNTSGNYKGLPFDDIRNNTIQDYERMESLKRGAWCFMGLRVVAKISVNGTTQTVKSGGLFGIESDSEDSYFAEVVTDELAELRTTLHEMGFSKRAIANAVKSADLSV